MRKKTGRRFNLTRWLRGLPTIFPSAPSVFRQMPRFAPRASIGAKILWRIGGCDLVRGGGQSFAFGYVLAFPADRAFRLDVVHQLFRNSFSPACSSRSPLRLFVSARGKPIMCHYKQVRQMFSKEVNADSRTTRLRFAGQKIRKYLSLCFVNVPGEERAHEVQ
jgi:hypothetical protein